MYMCIYVYVTIIIIIMILEWIEGYGGVTGRRRIKKLCKHKFHLCTHR